MPTERRPTAGEYRPDMMHPLPKAAASLRAAVALVAAVLCAISPALAQEGTAIALGEPAPRGATLHQAASRGDLVQLRARLAEGADVNQTDAGGLTALTRAVTSNQSESVRVLLEAGADPNIPVNNGQYLLNVIAGIDFSPEQTIARQIEDALAKRGLTPNVEVAAFSAAIQSNRASLEYWLAKGVDLLARNPQGQSMGALSRQFGFMPATGQRPVWDLLLGAFAERAVADPSQPTLAADKVTPLMAHAYLGEVGRVSSAMGTGLKPADTDVCGWNALHWAAAGSTLTDQMARLLIEGGVDVNALTGQNTTALAIAIGVGNVEGIKTLLALGASLVDPDYSDTHAGPIALAAWRGDIQSLAMLLDAAERAHAENRLTDTARKAELNAAGTLAVLGAQLDALRTLVKEGADPNAENERIGWLNTAIRTGKLHVVEEVLAAGATIAYADAQGKSPFDRAIEQNHAAIFGALLARAKASDALAKPVPGHPHTLGEAALVTASGSGASRLPMVRDLLDAGVHPDAVRSGELTALMAASGAGNADGASLLLERGASVSKTTVDGTSSALGYASTTGRGDRVMPLLLSRGADPNGVGAFGNSPLRNAVRANNPRSVRLLIEARASIADPTSPEDLLHDAIDALADEVVPELLRAGLRVAPLKHQSADPPATRTHLDFAKDHAARYEGTNPRANKIVELLQEKQ
jgi:ankyrin repeat protein